MQVDRKRQKPERTFWYTVVRILAAVILPVLYPFKYHNKDRIAYRQAPYMLISNHSSMLDPVLLALPIKPYEVRFLGKRELGKNKLFAYLLRKLHMITVSRHETDMAAMRACNEVLRKGQVLGIFPEGTRRPADQLMEGAESGVSLIALRNKVLLMPAYIHGKFRLFRRTHIYFLPELDYSDLQPLGVGKDVCDQLTQRIVQTMFVARDQAKRDLGA